VHVNCRIDIENKQLIEIYDPPRKRTYLKGYRGFKSLPLRQYLCFE